MKISCLNKNFDEFTLFYDRGIVHYLCGDWCIGQDRMYGAFSPEVFNTVKGQSGKLCRFHSSYHKVIRTQDIISVYFSLENSNVETVTELVNLITAQRAYEINSRAIKASDEMLSTINNMT